MCTGGTRTSISEIAHGAVGFLLFLVVPDSVSHHLNVGPRLVRSLKTVRRRHAESHKRTLKFAAYPFLLLIRHTFTLKTGVAGAVPIEARNSKWISNARHGRK